LRDARLTRANEVGKGSTRIMHPSRSIRRSGHPTCARAAFDCGLLTGTRSRGEHYGQRPWVSAASKGRTHGSTDQPCITSKKLLPTGSRPHMALSRRQCRSREGLHRSVTRTWPSHGTTAAHKREQLCSCASAIGDDLSLITGPGEVASQVSRRSQQLRSLRRPGQRLWQPHPVSTSSFEQDRDASTTRERGAD
jgi:hypothetical protein